ncbi:MAG: FAS1-like dehydratase domain-containing protein [Acidimicrobiales bacterium]
MAPSTGTEAAMRQWAARPPLVLTEHVSRKDIVRFAVATGETDEIHLDAEAARRRGFRDVVAPPLFYVCLRTSVFNLVPRDQLHEEGTPLRDAPPLQFSQAMAGETYAELSAPFVAGDVVTCSRRVETTWQKEGRSGTLHLVRFEYRYSDPAGNPFAVEHFTRIFR